MINLNELAKAVTLRECGIKELNISQVKNVMKIIFEEMGDYSAVEVLQVVERYA